MDHDQCFFRGLCILGELDNYLVRGRDQCVFSDVDVCSIEMNIYESNWILLACLFFISSYSIPNKTTRDQTRLYQTVSPKSRRKKHKSTNGDQTRSRSTTNMLFYTCSSLKTGFLKKSWFSEKSALSNIDTDKQENSKIISWLIHFLANKSSLASKGDFQLKLVSFCRHVNRYCVTFEKCNKFCYCNPTQMYQILGSLKPLSVSFLFRPPGIS